MSDKEYRFTREQLEKTAEEFAEHRPDHRSWCLALLLRHAQEVKGDGQDAQAIAQKSVELLGGKWDALPEFSKAFITKGAQGFLDAQAGLADPQASPDAQAEGASPGAGPQHANWCRSLTDVGKAYAKLGNFSTCTCGAEGVAGPEPQQPCPICGSTALGHPVCLGGDPGAKVAHGGVPTDAAAEKDVHTEHCCLAHGCKYGDEDCSVTSGKKKQSYPCEDCSDTSQPPAQQSHAGEPAGEMERARELIWHYKIGGVERVAEHLRQLKEEHRLAVRQTDSWIAKANREQELRIAAEQAAAQARKRVDQLERWLNDAAHEVGSDLDTVASAIRRKLAQARSEAIAECAAIARNHQGGYWGKDDKGYWTMQERIAAAIEQGGSK